MEQRRPFPERRARLPRSRVRSGLLWNPVLFEGIENRVSKIERRADGKLVIVIAVANRYSQSVLRYYCAHNAPILIWMRFAESISAVFETLPIFSCS